MKWKLQPLTSRPSMLKPYWSKPSLVSPGVVRRERVKQVGVEMFNVVIECKGLRLHKRDKEPSHGSVWL